MNFIITIDVMNFINQWISNQEQETDNKVRGSTWLESTERTQEMSQVIPSFWFHLSSWSPKSGYKVQRPLSIWYSEKRSRWNNLIHLSQQWVVSV